MTTTEAQSDKPKTVRQTVSVPPGTSGRAQRLAALLTLQTGKVYTGSEAIALAIEEAIAAREVQQ